jgi:hypothetical protein
MSEHKFAGVSRQLEEKLSETKRLNDPQLRRAMLTDMRQLLAETDRLAGETGRRSKLQENPNNEKQ